MVGDAGQPYLRKVKGLGERLDPQIVIQFCGFLSGVSNLQFTSRTLQPKSSLVALPKYLVESLAWRTLSPVPSKVRLASEWRPTLHRRDRTGELPSKPFMRRPKKQNTSSPGSHGQC